MKYLLILSLFLCSSCTILKRAKSKIKDRAKTEIDSVGKLNLNITETIDTNILMPGDSGNASKPLQNLLSGDTLEFETPTLKVKVHVEQSTGNVVAKAVNKPRVTTVKLKKTTHLQAETKLKKKSDIKHVEIKKETQKKKPSWTYLIVVIICALIIVAVVAYDLYTKRNL